MKKIFLGTALIAATVASAQDSTQKQLTLSGYAEVYYSYDLNKPTSNSKAPFMYSFTRNNEVSVNLGYLKAACASGRVRANLALGVGTYMNANYAAEPGTLKNVFEANVGVKLSNKTDLWLDGGIFASHIGFESAVGKDCWTVTRSIQAENSPYYESGVRLGYTSRGGKWYLSALVLNGWQHIQRPDGNTTPALGMQVTFKPSDAVTLNYGNFIGNDKPDSVRQMRYFNDFYAIVQPAGKWAATIGFDYGLEQTAKGSNTMNTWFSPILILKLSPDARNSVAVRGEYYSDPKGVIAFSGTPDGFKTAGWSINYDRQILPRAVWRLELREFTGKNAYFEKSDRSFVDSDVFITTSLAVSF